MGLKYKCPKCGNEKEFKVWSYVYVEQSYDQEKDDYGVYDDYGNSFTDTVACAECSAVVVQNLVYLKSKEVDNGRNRRGSTV